MGRPDRTSGRPCSFCFDHFPLLLLSMIGDTDLWWIPCESSCLRPTWPFLPWPRGSSGLSPQALPALASWGPVVDLWRYPLKTTVVLGKKTSYLANLHQIWPG